MVERYIPEISYTFDSIYSSENLINANEKIEFEDNNYIRGNVLASVPNQLTDNPNSAVYTWGASDAEENLLALGVSFTESALDSLPNDSETSEVSLMPSLGTGAAQEPEPGEPLDILGGDALVFPEPFSGQTTFEYLSLTTENESSQLNNFWQPTIERDALEQLKTEASASGLPARKTFEIELPEQVEEDGLYPRQYSIAYAPGTEGNPGEYSLALEQFELLLAPTETIESEEVDANSLSPTDRLAITELLFEYDFAIDSGDLEGTVNSFTTDGKLDAVFGSGEGTEGLTQFHQQLFDSGFDEGARHLTGNVTVAGDSENGTATGFSYLIIFEGEDEPGVIATATQNDTYRRENGEWKIASREIGVDPGFLNAEFNGDDFRLGTTSDDVLNGFEGEDRLLGLTGDDLLSGGTGDDSLQGDAGDDSLYGNAGQDILLGGLGIDTLTGNEDVDIFVLQSHGASDRLNHDIIDDFEPGTDVLALEELRFEQLSIQQSDNDTNIINASNSELLSTLTNVAAESITSDSFIDWTI